MIFWDTSAIVPLLVEERATPLVRAALKPDEAMVVWWGTPIEALSALCRRGREGGLTRPAVQIARRRLIQLSHAWHELIPTDMVREHADNLLLRHPLRAADALQLGAAITLAQGRPTGHRLATLDARLADAALGEGFDLVFPDLDHASAV